MHVRRAVWSLKHGPASSAKASTVNRVCSLAASVVLRSWTALNGTSAANVATFFRRVIVQCGPPAGIPYNTAASFRSKTVREWGLLYDTLSNWGPLKKVYSRD